MEENIVVNQRNIAALLELNPMIKDYVDYLSMEAALCSQQTQIGSSGMFANTALHLAFMGNSYTDKEGAAKLLARLYRDLGVLSREHMTGVAAIDLIAAHVGQTAVKTMKLIDRTLDGVLLIDEPQHLVDSNGFGFEALHALLERMETDRGRLVVILSGSEEPIQNLFNANVGIRRHYFPPCNIIYFPDHNPTKGIKDRL